MRLSQCCCDDKVQRDNEFSIDSSSTPYTQKEGHPRVRSVKIAREISVQTDDIIYPGVAATFSPTSDINLFRSSDNFGSSTRRNGETRTYDAEGFLSLPSYAYGSN